MGAAVDTLRDYYAQIREASPYKVPEGWPMNGGRNNGDQTTVCLCIPEDQKRHLPKRHRARWPHGTPLPRQGEVIYLSSSSAWGVTMVVHELRAGDKLVIEVWLEHVSSSRHTRPTGFALTQ